MADCEIYLPTAEQHRERASLLRRQAQFMSAEGRGRLLDIADEFDELADGLERIGFS